MTAYTIILVDDHVMFRQGLKKIIESAGDLEVIGEADNGLDLLGLLNRLIPQLIVLDISMPCLRGIETIHEVKMIRPEVNILVLTMHREMEILAAAVSAGAGGYLLKEDADRQFFSAIEKIRQGGIYLSPKLTDKVTDEWSRTCRGDRSFAPDYDSLTLREREVLKLTAEGKSSREIADLLCISSRTVEHHRANIIAKLNLAGHADLVKYAITRQYL